MNPKIGDIVAYGDTSELGVIVKITLGWDKEHYFIVKWTDSNVYKIYDKKGIITLTRDFNYLIDETAAP